MTDSICGLRGDQLVDKAGQILLTAIDLTVSKVITPDIKDKQGKPSTCLKAQSTEVTKSAKYQELFHAVDMSFLPVFFESEGLAGKRFYEHFIELIVRRIDKIGTPVAPLKVYWSRQLSVTLQSSVARAINIRMATRSNSCWRKAKLHCMMARSGGQAQASVVLPSGVVSSATRISRGSSR